MTVYFVRIRKQKMKSLIWLQNLLTFKKNLDFNLIFKIMFLAVLIQLSSNFSK